MNKYQLTGAELAAYQAVAGALSGLSSASQYNVLRVLAHNMDREVVRPGATRAAAAVAGASAEARSDAAGRKACAPKGRKTANKGLPEAFVQSADGQRLLAEQAARRAALSNPALPGELAALRAASAAVRTGLQLFLAVPPAQQAGP